MTEKDPVTTGIARTEGTTAATTGIARTGGTAVVTTVTLETAVIEAEAALQTGADLDHVTNRIVTDVSRRQAEVIQETADDHQVVSEIQIPDGDRILAEDQTVTMTAATAATAETTAVAATATETASTSSSTTVSSMYLA
jgi:hypothetical protein